MPKAMAIKAREAAISGNVPKSKGRLPITSMVQKAGNAKTKFRTPKPKEPARAAIGL